jgi:hypothetical protein
MKKERNLAFELSPGCSLSYGPRSTDAARGIDGFRSPKDFLLLTKLFGSFRKGA